MIELPDKLYHYCPAAAFYGIISERNLRLTNLFETNDYLEGKQMDKSIETVFDEFPCDDSDKKLFKSFEESVWVSYKKNRDIPPFFSSFSKERDRLSQWWGYAEDGTGFAIVFNPKFFNLDYTIRPNRSSNSVENIGIHRIIYAHEDKVSLKSQISETIKIYWNDYKRGNIVSSSPEQSNAYEDCAESFVNLTYFVKNPAFAEEEEWRILFRPFLNDEDNFVEIGNQLVKRDFYLKKAGTLSSFFKFSIGLPILNQPISEVMLGPKNNTTLKTTKSFLEKHGFRGVTIEQSAASYR